MQSAGIWIRWLLPIFLAVLLTTPDRAQRAATPDFSGIWKLNLTKSKLDKTGSTNSESIIVTSSVQSIQVHYPTTNGEGYTRIFLIDGSEHPQGSMDSGSVHVRGYSKAEWKGSTLVIQIRSHLVDPEHPTIVEPDVHALERWSLSSDGRILTETDDGPTGLTKRILVYDKQ
jgi:hypothetical protein